MALYLQPNSFKEKTVEIQKTISLLEQKLDESVQNYRKITEDIWTSPLKDKIDETYQLFLNNIPIYKEKLNAQLLYLRETLNTYQAVENKTTTVVDALKTTNDVFKN